MLSAGLSAVSGALQTVRNTASPYLSTVPAIESKKKEKDLELSEHDYEDFAQLLQLNDRLTTELSDGFTQEDLKKYDLAAPRPVVCGVTSAGKSSVLARLIGYQIFPVLEGVCTRRPFAVHLRNDPDAEGTLLRFTSGVSSSVLGKDYLLPQQIEEVRAIIGSEQKSTDVDVVTFDKTEIHAEVRSKAHETFTFTDLPGIFQVSDRSAGDYKKNRTVNESLRDYTLEMTKQYVQMPNAIVLVVISASDWMHTLNNDPFISHLAEWIEEVRKNEHREVPVYGVITKLDMQKHLEENSPLRKIFTGQLPKDHILHGLHVRRWIPIVASPSLLTESDKAEASRKEQELVLRCLRTSLPASSLAKLHVGRSALIKQLKSALLLAIGRTHEGMARNVEQFMKDIDVRLTKLPTQASASEKRRIFDARLKVLETALDDLIGPHGRQMAKAGGERSMRMQLLVDAPEEFEKELLATSLRGNLSEEVKQILDQAKLEQGGSFDSDMTFFTVSQTIVERYTGPCVNLVNRCAEIVASALLEAVHTAFAEYPSLEQLILAQLGVSTEEKTTLTSLGARSTATSAPAPTQQPLFQFLRTSAASKVDNLLDGFKTMVCFHPLWRNFDLLHQNILSRDPNREMKMKTEAANGEETLMEILNLRALASVVRTEADAAANAFASKYKEPINSADKLRVAKHISRVQVMGYIVRMSLIGSVFPLVLRDLRDGLFRGVTFAGVVHDNPVPQLLRQKLVFDGSDTEKRVFECMDPRPEDIAERARLTAKRETLTVLRSEFSHCQAKLRKLVDLIRD